MARPGVVTPVPVVCVGNLVAGGAGKTPTTLALAALLVAEGHRPAILSRGYGRRIARGTERHVLRVDAGRHEASEVGDEPLLLAAAAPTYVAADRRDAARQAVTEGATLLLLDDGLQNPTLHKTLTLAVVDGAAGVGNGLCVPAGPLRAPVKAQWPHVDALCIIGEGAPGAAVRAEAEARGLPVLGASLEPDATTVAQLRGQPLLGFAGIGRPEKFFATLQACNLDLRERRAFPDHHSFADNDRAALLRDADALGARLVTTAKDRMRLPPDFSATVLPVTLRFDDLAAVRRLLARLPPLPRR